MSEQGLTKQYCTELYLTDDEDGFGRVGNFCVYEAADVDATFDEMRDVLNVLINLIPDIGRLAKVKDLVATLGEESS